MISLSQKFGQLPSLMPSMGIRGRLNLAFGVVALFTVAAGVIGSLTFTTIERPMSAIMGRTLPMMGNAIQVLQDSAGLIAAGTSLDTQETPVALARATGAFQDQSAALKARVDSLAQARPGDPLVARLAERAGQIDRALRRKAEALAQRLEATRRKDQAVGRIAALEQSSLSDLAVRIASAQDRLTAQFTAMAASDAVARGFVGHVADIAKLSRSGDEGVALLDLQDRLRTQVSAIDGHLAGVGEQTAVNNLALFRTGLETASALRAVTALLNALVQAPGDRIPELFGNFNEAAERLTGLVGGSPDLRSLKEKTDALLKLNEGEDSIIALRLAEIGAADTAVQSSAAAAAVGKALSAVVAELAAGAVSDSESSAAEIANSVQRARTWLAEIGVLSLLASGLIAWFYVARRVTRRLGILDAAMRKVAAGDLEATVVPEGRDEIARMAEALVVFRDAAREASHLQSKAEEERRSARIERRREMMALAEEFEQMVHGVAAGLGRSADTVTEVARSMTDTAEETAQSARLAAAASDEASSNVQTVASVAEQLSVANQEIEGQMSMAAQSVSRAVTLARHSGTTVGTLIDLAGRVSDVVELISDITRRTNLLALNATIEATRAGEAGRGFAVVAAEVKDLSRQTAAAMERVEAQMAGIRDTSNDARKAIAGIVEAIGALDGITQHIVSAVVQQNHATLEISRSVGRAAAGSGSAARSIAGVEAAAVGNHRTADELLRLSREVGTGVTSLHGALDGFLRGVRADQAA